MKKSLLSGSEASFDSQIQSGVEWLGGDGFVAYPTETVWGLGACADRPLAIERLMEWKGRGPDAPLAVLVSSANAAQAHGCELQLGVVRLMERFWPGPLMIIVPCETNWSPGVARSDGALGLRCSSHPLAAALARHLEVAGLGPLTSTSLNRSGEPPARNDAEASRLMESLGTKEEASRAAPQWIRSVEYDAGGGAPSTVVDCTGMEPEVLRTGGIAVDLIRTVWTG